MRAYFREKKVAWETKQERQYRRTMRYMGLSQENYAIVTSSFLFIGFAIGVAALILFPLANTHPLLFLGGMMAVLMGSILFVNLVIERKMKKVGV